MSGQLIEFASPTEVMAHYQKDKENNQVVIFEGKVYDVKDYMPDHPGGPEYIEKNLGTNIEQEFEDAEHTKSAKKTLYKLPLVGTVSDKNGSGSDESQKNSDREDGSDGETVTNLFGEEFESKFYFDYDKPLVY